ncbi:uncharacterized protein LACBIDRAFT_335962 [Laccaria bicolor S238N-H82]|uniref:Predicted protein n=1 Tax=Laccaria bicolor (strain S238N-H82 / ATCC MYA-4686) TaxID=486041 RepID=B0E3Z1_LACBS|nr:uncharacterized protein LACBIDRAFT_335962 [Laccaria bicolor S238N-H82]EDQ98439.1 predicted protein [Laccaria bicolor S238N-H82]|eukprot:XP_001890909.1 predicted protein [Laccaria bicolor S238N-H82]
MANIHDNMGHLAWVGLALEEEDMVATLNIEDMLIHMTLVGTMDKATKACLVMAFRGWHMGLWKVAMTQTDSQKRFLVDFASSYLYFRAKADLYLFFGIWSLLGVQAKVDLYFFNISVFPLNSQIMANIHDNMGHLAWVGLALEEEDMVATLNIEDMLIHMTLVGTMDKATKACLVMAFRGWHMGLWKVAMTQTDSQKIEYVEDSRLSSFW